MLGSRGKLVKNNTKLLREHLNILFCAVIRVTEEKLGCIKERDNVIFKIARQIKNRVIKIVGKNFVLDYSENG